MRYILPIFVLFSLSAQADSWFGFCIAEHQGAYVCTQPQPRTNDFSQICDAFARQEGSPWWRAQFSTNLDSLTLSMADYCDDVRGGTGGASYACQVSILCQDQAQPSIKQLASRVYAMSEEQAIDYCFQKEEWRIEREFKAQSKNGCFSKIAVELMP